MPNLNAIIQRLDTAVAQADHPITTRLAEVLKSQNYRAHFSAETIRNLCNEFQQEAVDIALHALPLTACYALTPISQFNVGAVAIGVSGDFYFGANQEFTDAVMQQTVHAEQSALMHAWEAGETGVKDVVVNYTPCGHCRQFMNELNTADELHIHLPHSRNNPLHSYLPDAFGPKDLDIQQVMFDPQFHSLPLHGDELHYAAIKAAEQSYAPYSHTLGAVALLAGGETITGRYAENAAFNPSFLPLQSALNFYRLNGKSAPISRVVLAERTGTTSLRAMTAMLAQAYLGLELETVEL